MIVIMIMIIIKYLSFRWVRFFLTSLRVTKIFSVTAANSDTVIYEAVENISRVKYPS